MVWLVNNKLLFMLPSERETDLHSLMACYMIETRWWPPQRVLLHSPNKLSPGTGTHMVLKFRCIEHLRIALIKHCSPLPPTLHPTFYFITPLFFFLTMGSSSHFPKLPAMTSALLKQGRLFFFQKSFIKKIYLKNIHSRR